MDAAGIDVQLLFLNSSGIEQAEAEVAISVARESNDFLAEAVKKNPKRFTGLATLPIQSPDKEAEELERTIKQLGFKGSLINGHTRGRYLDDKFFWPILERSEALKAPIYLHPTIPPKAVVEAQFSGFSPAVDAMFAGAGWGWYIETAVHLLRMMLSGVFDKYPKLRVVVGHLSEGLTFMLPRLNKNMSPQLTKLQRPIGEYARENVYYSFGGFNFPGTFQNLRHEIGVDLIMFSVDYPYGSMEEARAFLEQLPVNDVDKERIAHGNAEQLFGL